MLALHSLPGQENLTQLLFFLVNIKTFTKAPPPPFPCTFAASAWSLGSSSCNLWRGRRAGTTDFGYQPLGIPPTHCSCRLFLPCLARSGCLTWLPQEASSRGRSQRITARTAVPLRSCRQAVTSQPGAPAAGKSLFWGRKESVPLDSVLQRPSRQDTQTNKLSV